MKKNIFEKKSEFKCDRILNLFSLFFILYLGDHSECRRLWSIQGGFYI